jgi:hypothetical protein
MYVSPRFSLNVTDVAFKLAAASLEKGQMPEPATVRSEEFINAFDYRDPEPGRGSAAGLRHRARALSVCTESRPVALFHQNCRRGTSARPGR